MEEKKTTFIGNDQLLLKHDHNLNTFRYALSGSGHVLAFADKVKKGEYKLETFACPICANLVDWIRVASSPEGFSWSVCAICGLLQIDKRLRHKDLNAFYESGEYHDICMGGMDGDLRFQYEYLGMSAHLISFLEQTGLCIADLRIVEVGCGSGGILRALKENGAAAKGFDLDLDCIEYGRQFVPEIFVADAMGDSADYGDCNLVLLSNVIEHLHEPKQFLTRLRKKLRSDDTVILIDVPNLEGANEYSKKSFLDFLHIGHLWYFNSITLERLLNEVGFKVISICNRGPAMSILCVKHACRIENNNNGALLSVSSINHANYDNDENNSMKQVNKALHALKSQKGMMPRNPLWRRVGRKVKRATNALFS